MKKHQGQGVQPPHAAGHVACLALGSRGDAEPLLVVLARVMTAAGCPALATFACRPRVWAELVAASEMAGLLEGITHVPVRECTVAMSIALGARQKGRCISVYGYMCICLWIRVHVYIFMCVCMCVCVCLCEFLFMCLHNGSIYCIYVYIYICICIYIYAVYRYIVQTHRQTFAQTHTHMNIYTCTCIHRLMHIYV